MVYVQERVGHCVVEEMQVLKFNHRGVEAIRE